MSYLSLTINDLTVEDMIVLVGSIMILLKGFDHGYSIFRSKQ